MFITLLSFEGSLVSERCVVKVTDSVKYISLNSQPGLDQPLLMKILANVFNIHFLLVLISVVEVVILLMIR